jgi:hypothetical protein
MNKPQIIPKIIHRIWIGPKPLSETAKQFIKMQEGTCREYESILWDNYKTEKLYPFMLNMSSTILQDADVPVVAKTDILRFEILRLFGGIYLDTDIETLRNFDELLDVPFLIAFDGETLCGTGVLGAISFHPLTFDMLKVSGDKYKSYGAPKTVKEIMNFCGPSLLFRFYKKYQISPISKNNFYPDPRSARIPNTIHYFQGCSETGWTRRVVMSQENQQWDNFTYTKSLLTNHKLKYPFPGFNLISRSHAQSLQDIFVLSVMGGGKGSFLEIGAYDPVFMSNTFLLEKTFGWKGTSIEIEDVKNKFIQSGRKGDLIIGNALKIDYCSLLNGVDRVDYLSLDIDPNTKTLECLIEILKCKTRFSIITYEHDYYNRELATARECELARSESRRILSEAGYILVAGNIAINDVRQPFEDWWIDGRHFGEKTVSKFFRVDDKPITAKNYLFVEIENDTKNNTSNLAGHRPNDGAVSVFHGRNRKV